MADNESALRRRVRWLLAELRRLPRWFLTTVAAAIVSAVVAGLLSVGGHTPSRPAAPTAVSTARVYQVSLAAMQRGVDAIIGCHEKLNPFTPVSHTQIVGKDKALLATVMSNTQLGALESASNAVEELFAPGYSAPRSGTAARAAYSATVGESATRTTQYLTAALAALRGVTKQPPPTFTPFNCAGLPRDGSRPSR
ncbi:MAG: hypothetical protein JWN10_1167 [Solirubrobacterales bacterium]|nr:hypothetical protein [Solirubrobacterales bacterium]